MSVRECASEANAYIIYLKKIFAYYLFVSVDSKMFLYIIWKYNKAAFWYAYWLENLESEEFVGVVKSYRIIGRRLIEGWQQVD